MKNEFRAHPLMVLSELTPFLFFLIIPLTRAGLQYIISGSIKDIIGTESIVLIFIAVITVLRCLRFKVLFDGEFIVINKGCFIRSSAKINKNHISSIEEKQNLFDVCFSAVTFCVNTEAGRRKKSDFKFKLRKADSKRLSSLLYGNGCLSVQSFSPIKTALWAISASSVLSGFIIGIPVVNNIGRLLDFTFTEVLKKFSLNDYYRGELFSSTINVLTLIFLVAYSFSFVYRFIKYVKFRLYTCENSLEVHSGFFVKRKTRILKSAINSVALEQSLIMLLLKRFCIKINVAGLDVGKGSSELVALSANNQEVEKEYAKHLPILKQKGKKLSVRKDMKKRFLFLPTVLIIVLPILFCVIGLVATDFSALLLFCFFITMYFVFKYAFFGLYECNNAYILYGKSFRVKSTRCFGAVCLSFGRSSVSKIVVRRFFTDKKYGTCRVIFTIASQKAEKIRVRHLEYEKVLDMLRENFSSMYNSE